MSKILYGFDAAQYIGFNSSRGLSVYWNMLHPDNIIKRTDISKKIGWTTEQLDEIHNAIADGTIHNMMLLKRKKAQKKYYIDKELKKGDQGRINNELREWADGSSRYLFTFDPWTRTKDTKEKRIKDNEIRKRVYDTLGIEYKTITADSETDNRMKLIAMFEKEWNMLPTYINGMHMNNKEIDKWLEYWKYIFETNKSAEVVSYEQKQRESDKDTIQ